ncbi:MAG: efflux RND transporter permease subunit [bacterium]
MDLLTTFIRRPVLASMIILFIVVMGLFSYFQLGIDSMPKVDFPLVLVSTTLPGAGPEEIETELTKPIEDAIAVLGGIDHMNSTSMEGISTVTVMFQLGKNPDVAAQEVRDKVNGILNKFPEGTKTPIVMKYDSQAIPIMVLAVHGKRSAKELTELCRQKIKDDIGSVDGVGQVNMLGARYREIQVVIHADKLTKFGLTIDQVKQAVQGQNFEIPGGRVSSKDNEYTLRTFGRLKNVESFHDIIVKNINGMQIKIRDIGYVVDGVKEARTLSRLNGEATLTLQVVKNSDANIAEVCSRVRGKIEQMSSYLPGDIHLEVVKDSSLPIKKQVDAIMEHLLIGGGLACLMVLLFMGSLQSTFIAALAIPSSIIATFSIMKAMNFTLNQVTLLALALVVGIVIDDAIVVLENIWRLMEEEGKSAFDAAVEGTREIGPAVIATTLSLIVLFIPVAFMPGIVGRYFQSYGITMAVAIFFSMVVSFVLTPMACSKLLKPPVKKAGEKKEPGFLTRILQDGYEKILVWALKFRFLVILISIACVWLGIVLYGKVGKEFIAQEDTGDYNIAIKLPKGWPIPRSSEELKPLEAELLKMPHVRYVLTSVGTQAAGAADDESSDVSQCNIYVRLTDFAERKPYTQFKAMREARRVIKKYRLFRTSVQPSSDTGGSGGSDFSFSIQGDDLDVLYDASQKVLKKLSSITGYVDLDTNLEMVAPEVQVKVDRAKAADLNVDLSTLSNSLKLMVGGDKISNYQDGKWLYDVRLRLAPEDRDNPAKVANLFVPTQQGKPTYLAGFSNVGTGFGPSTIYHFNRQRMVTINANLEDYPQMTAMDDAKKIVSDLHLPSDYNIAYQGSAMWIGQTFLAFALAFILATIFMYMVLAAQFENLLDPVIILTTLPLSIPFALLSLMITKMTLNIFSALGLFLLFGIVKKNAILQIDHTNNLRRMGLSDRDAILRANRERLRPILMTTLTLVVGMLPVALAGPEGATQSPMAIVVVGGQSLCLILTLLLIPVALSYAYDLEKWKEWKIWTVFRGQPKKASSRTLKDKVEKMEQESLEKKKATTYEKKGPGDERK